MIYLCGLYGTNEFICATKTDSQREQTCGCQDGVGVGGWIENLELADTNYYIQNG